MEPTKNDNKYLNGKIYTIRSHQTDKYYIGSTIQPLHKRLHCHRKDLKYNAGKRLSSFEIIKFDDNYIELLEEYPCENKNQLCRREGELIRQYKNNLVNLHIAGRTLNEWTEDNKDNLKEKQHQYYADNKGKCKMYVVNNKERVDKYQREYRIKHKENIAEYGKKHAENNKERIAEHKRQYYILNIEKTKCECGSTVGKLSMLRHNTSKKHINYLQTIVTPDTI